MSGLSCWTVKGGCYRTVQRFFYTVIPWAKVFWAFFREHLFDYQDTYLLAGDESVVIKAGKQTHGDNFHSTHIAEPTYQAASSRQKMQRRPIGAPFSY